MRRIVSVNPSRRFSRFLSALEEMEPDLLVFDTDDLTVPSERISSKLTCRFGYCALTGQLAYQTSRFGPYLTRLFIRALIARTRQQREE